MPDLQTFSARVCLTAAAWCVHQDKILMVKHKKLNMWLAPGGHIEANELPHQAAKRECFEETGVQVSAVQPKVAINSLYSEFVPTPLFSNLHWVCQANYHSRLRSANPTVPNMTKIWPRGCEQHLVLAYLVKPIGSTQLSRQLEETDAIGWFERHEALNLDTSTDIKAEIEHVFKYAGVF